jgi:ABC-2 type transport system permease protein
MAASLLLYIGPIVGMIAANVWLLGDPEQLGPFTLVPYLWAAVFVVIPNVVFMGGVFFAVAALTRSLLATYLGVVGTMMAFGISRVLLRDLESHAFGAMMDPFGLAALRVQTRYWTLIEKNSIMPEVDGLLLANRLLWVVVGLAVLAAAIWWFDPARGRKAKRVAETGPAEHGLGALPSQAARRGSRVVNLGFGLADRLKMLAQQSRFETVAILRGAPFIVILAFAIFNVAGEAFFREMIQGTTPIPVTRIKLEALDSLTHESLRGDRMFLIFLQQCESLSRKIQERVIAAS